MISLQYGTTLYTNFINSLNLWMALMHLVRSNLLCLWLITILCVDVYAKPTNSFVYVLSSICYPKKSINKIFRWKIWYSKLWVPYLIARDYNLTLVKKQFHSDRNMSRSDARQVKPKSHRSNTSFVTVILLWKPYKLSPEITCQCYMMILKWKFFFPEGSINVTYKRGKSLFLHQCFLKLRLSLILG